MSKRTEPFSCYYCGQLKDAGESSDEHIVPTSIGGTRNATFTNEVCKSCNDYMSGHVDLPFSRDWFIQSSRVIAGIVNKGKAPVHFMGYLQWERPENASVFVTQKGVTIIEVSNTPDGHKRLLLGVDPQNKAIFDHALDVIRKRFPSIPVANFRNGESKPYDEELTSAVMALGGYLSLHVTINIAAWHRELWQQLYDFIGCRPLAAVSFRR